MKILLAIIGIVASIWVLIFGFKFVGQEIEYKNFRQYNYRIIQDNQYWFTNSFSENDRCIVFVSNYNTNVKWCEKYQVEVNYWHNNKPSIKSVYFGY